MQPLYHLPPDGPLARRIWWLPPLSQLGIVSQELLPLRCRLRLSCSLTLTHKRRPCFTTNANRRHSPRRLPDEKVFTSLVTPWLLPADIHSPQ